MELSRSEKALAIITAHRNKRDAARYRYLRSLMLPISHPHGDAWSMTDVILGDDLESSIDMAIYYEGFK